MLNPILIIIGINFLLFIATTISPGLVYDLGLYSSSGDFFSHPWGLVTSMFLHGGFFHIFANMLTFYFFGSYLLRLVGTGRLLAVYFGGGIMGNILFVLMTSSALAIGASGAVFSLGGALAVMMPRLRVFIFPIPAPIPLWIAVIGGFIILSFVPDVAWEAHLGGLLFGLVAGYLFKQRGRRYY
jgi:membrane associated rhomboid family serine protease